MPTVCAMSVYKRSQKFLQIRQKIEKDSLVEHLLTLPVGILELTESAVRDEQYKLFCQAVYSRLDQCGNVNVGLSMTIMLSRTLSILASERLEVDCRAPTYARIDRRTSGKQFFRWAAEA